MTTANTKPAETIAVLCQKLKEMRMSGMAAELERQAEAPNTDLIPAEERIEKLIEAEWDLRYQKKFSRYLKKASLRYPQADIDQSIYDADRQLDTESIEHLTDCKWIEEGKTLLITGPAGGGKTWASNAFCINALRQFKTVRYVKTSNILYEIEKADLNNQHLEYINSASQLDLLVLDDFGLMPLDPNMCRNLFELIDAREGRKSTIVISQLPVKDWFSIFKDNTYADACLDRLVSKAYRLEFNGKNMRNPNLSK